MPDLDYTEIGVEASDTIKRRNRIWGSLFAAGLGMVGLFLFSTQGHAFLAPATSSAKLTSKGVRTSIDSLNMTWSIYKHTTSITSGTITSVTRFVDAYISPISLTKNLGCNTTKTVGSLVIPSSDTTVYSFSEIHWVDSSIFSQTGISIGDWADYIDGLQDGTFNTFMHNKVQMYVPDAHALYTLLEADEVDATYRISKSFGSDSLDTVHIGLWIAEASTVYEIVAPSSSFSRTELEDFSEWDSDSCLESHALSYSLDYYQEQYDTVSLDDTQSTWTESTGLYVPMGIAITNPTSSLDYLSDTISMITSITGVNTTTTTSSTCAVLSADFSTSSHFEPIVRYVVNSAANQGTDYTVGDWETAITQTHSDLLNMTAEYSSWDRYLDTHIGIIASTMNSDSATCSEVLSSVTATIADHSYSLRVSDDAAHYYVGTEVTP